MLVPVRRCGTIQSVKSVSNITHFSSELLASAYKPHLVETVARYEKWQNELQSQPKDNDRFIMLLPPPNITGTLHLGHTLTVAIQDAIVRWNRLQNKNTYWIPGFDHASIATQSLIEKRVQKQQSLTKLQIGRDTLLNLIDKWKHEKCSKMRHQLQILGAQLNWSLEYYTLDAAQVNAVQTAFIDLFDRGLIYQAKRLVNWSCALQSTVSDIEVDHLEIDGPTKIKVPGYDTEVEFGVLTKFAYKVDDGTELLVATTRPETLMGDVAIAVNPNDSRYFSYHNKNAWNPLRNEYIPIICDDSVNINLGTGAIKVTPAHSSEDYKIAQRHNLNLIPVIDESGYLINPINNTKTKRFIARKLIIDKLKELNLWKSNEPHQMLLPICSRSGDVIEYLLKPQWFLNCSQMTQEAIRAVEEGQLIIEPKNFEKIWFQWLQNSNEWCISRQLWFGHQIPAFRQKSDPEKWTAAKSLKEAQKKLGVPEHDLEQDQDVLDTWFSSAILPFSTTGWPKKETYSSHFPLSLMTTGHDILFFWVARMTMLSQQLLGKLPFSKVILHGIICDNLGRKMSKSLGNVLSPEDVIYGTTLEELNKRVEDSYNSGLINNVEKKKAFSSLRKMFPQGIPECGTDALRFTLCSHNFKKCYANRIFANKIWQAVKFANFQFDQFQDLLQQKTHVQLSLSEIDLWILTKLLHFENLVEKGFRDYDFYLAVAEFKKFFRNQFCDIYIESTKTAFCNNNNEETIRAHCVTLSYCLDRSLKLLSPFMPYLSDELLSKTPKCATNISAKAELLQQQLEKVNRFEQLLNNISAI